MFRFTTFFSKYGLGRMYQFHSYSSRMDKNQREPLYRECLHVFAIVIISWKAGNNS